MDCRPWGAVRHWQSSGTCRRPSRPRPVSMPAHPEVGPQCHRVERIEEIGRSLKVGAARLKGPIKVLQGTGRPPHQETEARDEVPGGASKAPAGAGQEEAGV